jgi:hypothetical protein
MHLDHYATSSQEEVRGAERPAFSATPLLTPPPTTFHHPRQALIHAAKIAEPFEAELEPLKEKLDLCHDLCERHFVDKLALVQATAGSDSSTHLICINDCCCTDGMTAFYCYKLST